MRNRKEKVIDDTFTYTVATEILKGNNNDKKPRIIYECRQRKYWRKMRIAMKVKFESQMNVVYLNL